MLKKALALSILLPLSTISVAGEGMIRIKSQHSVAETADKLVKVLTSKGMTVFNRIEHSKGAQKVGINIVNTQVVIFGNPKVGSPLMKCAPTVAIDLPQKALIQEDEKNVVWISYNNPQYLKERHNIVGCDVVLNKVSKALSNFATAAAS
jgi:uncharacterized protein (DUF302 family)